MNVGARWRRPARVTGAVEGGDMRIGWRLSAFLSFFAVLVLAAPQAVASHARFGHLTWQPRPDLGANRIELTAKVGFRRSAFGAPLVGDMVNLSGSATILWGDGGVTTPSAYEVLSVDVANDWFLAEARGVIHTYPAPSNGSVPWIVQISNCCRIYSNRNAPGTNYRYQTSVDLRVPNSSPRSTAPPIVFMAVNVANSIVVPVAEADGDTFNCRLATFTESGIPTPPGPGVSGPVHGLTVTAAAGGCQVNWDTTGTVIGELWALQIAIEDSRGGTQLGRTALEFLIEIVGEIGEPPICDVPPTPSGTISIADNTMFAATIQGSDPDAGETLVLNSTGIPSGATVAPPLPIVGGSPISTTLTWTPTLLDLGPQPFLFSVTDSNNLQVLCSFTLDVQFDPFGGIATTPTRGVRGSLRRPPTGGPDPDTEGGRCVETTDPDCAPPVGPTPGCMPDFTGVPFQEFPAGQDSLDIDILLTEGDGQKTVCCELIDAMSEISGPFCQIIELVSAGCSDVDGDGFGSPGDAACPGGPAEDCDDSAATVNPAADEACQNGVDDDCDGVIDEDVDAPVITCPADVTLECPASTDPTNAGMATATDNCGVVSLVPEDGTTPDCGGTQAIVRAWTATDAAGNDASCSQIIAVGDTTPPTVSVPASLTQECNSAGGVSAADPLAAGWLASAISSDSCGASSVSHNAPGFFFVGTTSVTFTATDDCGNSTDGSSAFTVQDTIPPQISVSLEPSTLWPPNHRMVDILSTVTVTDVCTPSPTWLLAAVTSNEPDDANGVGDGNTDNDIQGANLGTPDASLSLRAERQGTGNGRVYTVTYVVSDASGNQTTGSDLVLVPHDQSGRSEPVMLSVDRNAAGTIVGWSEVPGALYYNVVRGNLASLVETGSTVDLGSLHCVEAQSQDLATDGNEDLEIPAPGEAFFYLVEYNDGWNSSYGTETAPKPRVPQSGGCE